jgi:hypothetical protein
MTFRSLVVLPLALAAVFLVAGTVAGDGALPAILTAEGELAKAVALGGCLAAAMAFESGDYLRRAWAYSALCYLVLLLRDGLLLGAHMPASSAVLGGLAIVANVASVAGTWMLAHAWRLAGIDEDAAGRARGRLLFVGGAVVALAITGLPFLRDLGGLSRGELGSIVDVASDLGDTICLALVAPVLQTALAMRGGVLRWPWGLLTASGVAWIAYDAASAVAQHPRWLLVSESVRMLACGLVLAAGLAQRMAVAPDDGAPGPG